MAHDNADVRELNRLARERLDAAGMLGADRLAAAGREWAAGDRLICRQNDYRPGLQVRNGTRATVLAVQRQAGSLWVITDEGRQVHLPGDYLAHAHHAYATTGNVSQGATVDYTFLLASPARGGREWAYVAGSRQRIDLRAYLTHHDPEGARGALAAAWERSQAKHLAGPFARAQQAAAWLAHAHHAPESLRAEPEEELVSAPRHEPASRPASGIRLGMGP